MRKYLLIPVLLLSLNLYGQFQKNQVYPGLSIGQQISRSYITTYRPSVSMGINRHWAAGIFYERGRYESWKENNRELYRVNHSGGISLDYASYFSKTGKLGFVIRNSFYYTRSNFFDKQARNTPYASGNTYGLKISPGIFYQATPRTRFFLHFGNISINHNPDAHNKWIAGSDLLFEIGVQFRLGRKNGK